MIEINLLPGSSKRSSKRPKTAGKSKKGGGSSARPKMPNFDSSRLLVIVGWALGLAIVGWLHVSMSTRLEALSTEREAAARDSARYAVLRAQGDSLLAQEQRISQKLQIIQEIDAGRFTWSHILDEVSRALPPYVWVVNMSEAFSEAGVPRLRLEGRAGNYFAIGRYLEDLEASPFLRQVRLISSSQTTADQRTVLGFIVEASYEEPGPDMIETVPIFGAVQGDN